MDFSKKNVVPRVGRMEQLAAIKRYAIEDDYVMGLEPANCLAEDYNSMAKKGLLRHIEPGQTVETCIRLEL